MIYKRKHNKKTNYKKRLTYLLARKPRLVIRRTNKAIYAQIIEYEPKGDKAIISATSRELPKLGYKGAIKNIPSAYLTGLLIAKKSKEKSIKSAVPDIGFHSHVKGSLIFALIKGAKDGGLDLSINESILPDESKIQGKHIAEFAKKKNLSPDLINLPANLEEIKGKLLGK